MKIKLYNYQEIALEKVLYALRRFGRALMVMATGLGKTIVSSKLVELFLSDNPGKRILFLSHDNGILEQSLLKYESIFGNRYSYARFFGAKKDWNADKYDIVFATFQSSPHKLFNADHFDFIIVDESHHSKADTYFECLQYFRPKWKLGMTATPDREDEQDIRSIFGKEVVCYDLPEALANGWLTPVEYKMLSDGLDREMLEKICYEVLVENVRITEGQLNDRIFIHSRTEEQCNKIVEYTKSGLKAIVFCRNITHLEHVHEILPNSVIVHSERTDDQNYDAEQKYVSGQASHILVVDKYNEGKDLPDTDVLVFLRGTESYRIWAQQLGRGLRLFPGKEKVVVLDFVANIERIKNVDKLMKQLGQFETNSLTESLLKLNSPLHIEGENFIFDFTSEIVNIFSALERIAMPFYSTWQEASFAAKKLGIKNMAEYNLFYKNDNRLSSAPQSFYGNFPGWYVFLGKKNPLSKYSTWQEASNSCASLGIFTEKEYKERYKEDRKLPSSPRSHYKDFPGFRIFIGKSSSDYYETWQEASESCISLGILNLQEYILRYKEDLRLPSNLDQFYKDFPGFRIFIGKSSSDYYETWQEASESCISLGILSQEEYRERYKEDLQLPSTPPTYYKDFPGFHVFLGKNKYETWQEASESCISLGIFGYRDYREKYKADKKLPSNPQYYYTDFPGWKKFLGKI